MGKNSVDNVLMKRLGLILAMVSLCLGNAACQLPSLTSPPPPTPTAPGFASVQPGDGSDLLDQLLANGKLRAGMRVWPAAEYAPPAFRDTVTGGALNGFEVETVRLVAAGLGLELELIEADPWLLEQGSWDNHWDVGLGLLAPLDQPAVGASPALRYTIPYVYLPTGIALAAADHRIEDLDQWVGRRLGVLEYSLYQRHLMAQAPLTIQQQQFLLAFPAGIRPVPLSSLQASIQVLGRVGPDERPFDALFGPTPIFEQAMRQGERIKLAPKAKFTGFHPASIAVTPRDGLAVERLISEINRILVALQQQGLLAELHLKWYGQDYSRPR